MWWEGQQREWKKIVMFLGLKHMGFKEDLYFHLFQAQYLKPGHLVVIKIASTARCKIEKYGDTKSKQNRMLHFNFIDLFCFIMIINDLKKLKMLHFGLHLGFLLLLVSGCRS